ncbi:MAG TPA: CBS domain-containing protein [Longimicrobiales bacterium]|nr:CBS domain-containing protein [Longimicrobiales bacterium]
MKIRDILRTKGTNVIAVEPDQPVLAAVRVLSEHRIGAVVVRHAGEMLGILSERDILNLAAGDPARLETARVEEVMTRDVIVGSPEDELNHVMNVMTENRIRHLPIVVGAALEGIVSIGDVVNAVRRSVESENRHLMDYIHGIAG